MCKKQGYAVAVFAISTLFLLVSSVLAQKVKVDSDKSTDLSRYKRYAWNKNRMVTALSPEDQSRVEGVLNDSINRQMQAKGYTLDEKNPDFRISYDAGGQLEGGAGVRPDLYRLDTGGYSYVAPMDVWAVTLAQMRISIVSAASNASVWQATVSQKVSDRDKFMRELNRNIDKITASALKKLPVAYKGS